MRVDRNGSNRGASPSAPLREDRRARNQLLVGQPLVPLALETGALPFRVQPSLPRCRRRPRGAARYRRDGGALGQLDQALARVLTIALLRPVALGGDGGHTLPGQPPARPPPPPPAPLRPPMPPA